MSVLPDNISNASDRMKIENRNINVIPLEKERNVMAFVNEFASDEDIEKYDLNGIWDQYHPLRKGRYYCGQAPMYTIDRERNIFFMVLGGGGEEHTNRLEVLLWINAKHVVVEIDLAIGSSPNINDVPFKQIWELVAVHPENSLNKSKEELVEILKEALIVHGFDGANRQVPNTIVEFKF
ncbi:MAG: hypothetical protein AB2806_20630 [Candidatus Thiodiazotropha sp.]